MLTTAGKWFDYLADRRALDAVYGSPPELIELMGISLLRDGPKLDLNILLDRLPDPMPPKWEAQRCNSVLVVLRITLLQDLCIRGWGTDNAVSASFAGEPRDFRFQLSGPSTQLEGSACHMFIDRFSAYRSLAT
jgi:hypothetical protein